MQSTCCGGGWQQRPSRGHSPLEHLRISRAYRATLAVARIGCRPLWHAQVDASTLIPFALLLSARAMHTISGNLQVAEATMQQLASNTLPQQAGNSPVAPQAGLQQQVLCSPQHSTGVDAMCQVTTGPPAQLCTQPAQQISGTKHPTRQVAAKVVRPGAANGASTGYSSKAAHSVAVRKAAGAAVVQKHRHAPGSKAT